MSDLADSEPAQLQHELLRIIRDVEDTTNFHPGVAVMDDDDDDPAYICIINFDGEETGARVSRDDLARGGLEYILAEVADIWSEAVTEQLAEVDLVAARHWPLCPAHEHSVGPAVVHGEAVWKCPVDDSIRAPIGLLEILSSR